MRVKREEMIEDLIDPRSMVMHKFSAKEILCMTNQRLLELYNKLMEPIDEGDIFVLDSREYEAPPWVRRAS